MKNKNLKKIGATLIVISFLFLAFGSGESSSDIALNKAEKKQIIEALSKTEMEYSEDMSAGNSIATYKISLKMEKDMTFKYAFEENYFNGTTSPINAKGSYELIGKVEKINLPGFTDKYGQDVGEFKYEQKIKFIGVTNEGKNFTLQGSLIQSGDSKGLENYWFFSGENKSRNDLESTSVENFTLPLEKIYP